MLRNPKFFRAAMLVFGFALAMPVALAVTRDIASASGYILAGGIDGEMHCMSGDGNDCSPE
jgi:hypothetical protein